ncbi:MAG: aminotransferase class IV [Methylacidiphilales bacterium]|nr:aminotransferase class IV [Candidatus Methylacidiphilales bacterium]
MNKSGDFAPWLGVFETLRVVDGKPLFVAEHRAELGRAMGALGLTSDFDFARAGAELPPLSGRWRWIVTPEGTRTLFSEEAAASVEPLSLSVSPVRVGSQNWDARFKTMSHLAYAQAGKTALTAEVVLLNEKGDVACASHGNIFWRRGDTVFTPAHEAGCRRGVVRGFVRRHRKVETGHFPLGDLLAADEIFLTNSVKGIVSMNEVQGRALGAFPCADRLREAYAEAVAAQLSG